jgi:signal transduction histidine kinase
MTATGGGTLKLSTCYDHGSVVMDVRDSGPGIPEATKARIFEPFFTTKDEGEGTGLGLSVSYGIVTAHGGTIEAAETSSNGTTIRVTLPSREAL